MSMRGIFPERYRQPYRQLSGCKSRLYCIVHSRRGYSSEKMAENGWRLA
jgi:hypothetical protein